MLDPTGVLRDQEGKYVPDRFNRAQLAVERERSPGRNSSRRRTPPRGSKSSKNREGNPTFNLNQDDTQATRTLFVGNLPGDVRESEIRRVFEIYGVVEEVDIKVLSDNNAAYAFIQFKVCGNSDAQSYKK
jgi:RNA recognition motif-containing protein